MQLFSQFISLCTWPMVVWASTWIIHILYFICLIPQIMINYKMKSGTGISDAFLFCYLNIYLLLPFYIFGLDLPMAYKVLVPLQGVATLVLIGQRLYYDKSPNLKKLKLCYGCNFFAFFPFVPVAIGSPLLVGVPFGWVGYTFAFVSQIPQAIKIHREKSVKGFSFLFVLFNGIAAILEVVVAFVLELPLPTRISAMRGVFFFVVFCWQFALYRKYNA